MRDEKKLAAFIDATLDDTLAGLTDLLPPEAMAAVRGRLHDDLVAHPAMRPLAREQAPVEIPQAGTDEGITADAIDEAKKHG